MNKVTKTEGEIAVLQSGLRLAHQRIDELTKRIEELERRAGIEQAP